NRAAHMHVGAMVVFEGPPPAYKDLLALIASRIDAVPRYRQRLMFVPLAQGRPVWVDDAHFDLEYHVRHTALPAPGGEAELKRLTGRLLSQQLDRDKPLWELWFVEGLGDGQFAIISKTHHCMVDGISGVDIATVLMDADRDAKPPGAPKPWSPRPGPSQADLLFEAAKSQLTRNPFKFVKEALEPESEARRAATELLGGILPLMGLAQMGNAPPSSLNQLIGPHRRFETVTFDLARIKRVRAVLGGTVNDIILAVVAGALRTLLRSRGEHLGPDLRVMVPVSVRAPAARGSLGNQVTAVFCPLPVAEADPVRRLLRVSAEMKGLKESGQAVGALALTRIGEFTPPTLVAQAARLQSVTRFFNIVVTNVPGPQFPLYLLGRRLQGCYPVVPLAAQQTVGIALLSYDGIVGVGLVGDSDRARDLPILAEAMEGALSELLDAANAKEAHAEHVPRKEAN
ncbi:MAG: wax ester/triacylglycerol synthase family O-acyltransferase, partial [Polyangiaceae bacterium]